MSTSIDSTRVAEVFRPLPEPKQARATTDDSARSIETATAFRAEEPGAAQRLQDAVKRVSDVVQLTQRDLEFSVDDQSGRTVVKVINSDSGELIRQIPAEEVLAAAEDLKEVRSVLFRGLA